MHHLDFECAECNSRVAVATQFPALAPFLPAPEQEVCHACGRVLLIDRVLCADCGRYITVVTVRWQLTVELTSGACEGCGARAQRARVL